MEHKIFLGKYRIAPDEVALAAVEPASVSVATAAQQVTTARIYRGEEIDSGRDVTVEVIPAASFKPSVRSKLEEEATAAKQINHINIPALYDFGVEDEQLVYVTEHFEGTTAEEWVNAHSPMPTGAVLRIALQVMGAMGAAAFHKISHHAINPANLLLVPGQTPEGDWPLVKVLHFIGVAPTFVGGDMSVATFDKSTHYASPEQLQGKPVDFRSEIYSLGATMWFLLTGAPPLMAPKGPLAMQPTTIGLAVDKLNGMPKRVRRLLAQMLSVDPATRPQDPLAVYRQIQDCVAQVERRESMAKRLGVPFLSGTKVAALPSRRRFPGKLVALAAVIAAMAIIASVSVASYWRHQRVRQAEEPIGVPIGVPDANASVAPVTASAPTVAPVTASAPTVVPEPPRPLPQNTAPIVAARENQPTTKTESAPGTAANPPSPAKDETTPVVAANQPPPSNEESKQVVTSKPKSPSQSESAPVVAANQPPPAKDESKPDIAANPPAPSAVEPETAGMTSNARSETPKVAAHKPKAVEEKPEPTQSKEVVRTEPREETPVRDTEIATARAASPEVRRAEPAPAEGPEEVAPAAESKVAPATTTKKERARKPKRQVAEEQIPRAEPVDGNEESIPRARSAGDEEVIASEAPRVQDLPRSRNRAKFIGVTADGNWMFSLPNKKVVIVPPPPGG